MDRWTPREQRSRDRWRQHLANFQVKFGLSIEEMDTEIKKQVEEKIEVLEQNLSTPNTTIVVYNSADYVLSYLTPPRRKKKLLPLA